MARRHLLLRGVSFGVTGLALLFSFSLFVRSCFRFLPVQEPLLRDYVEKERVSFVSSFPEEETTEPLFDEVPFGEERAFPSPFAPSLLSDFPLGRHSAPSSPSSLFVSARAKVPSPPSLKSPAIMPLGEGSSSFVEEEDLFADFYVSGEEDSFLYEEGSYYLSLFVNEQYQGEIEARFSESRKTLSMRNFKQMVGSDLTQQAYHRLFGDGLEYLSFEDLALRNVTCIFDDASFSLYVSIPFGDYALRSLSVSPRGHRTGEQYVMEGAEELDGALFAWVAAMNLYGSLSYPSSLDRLLGRSVSWHVANKLSFCNIALDFSFSLYNPDPESLGKWEYQIGNWVAFREFEEKGERFSFGSVGSNLSERSSSVSGISTNIGFSLEKQYGFGGKGAPSSRYSHTISVLESSTIYIFLNNREENDLPTKPTREELEGHKHLLFSRHLQPGTYRLKDFVFAQGHNKITIYLYPDSRPQEPEVTRLEASYDTRLMVKGEATWGFALSMPKALTERKSDAGDFRYYDPLRRKWASFYPEYASARFWQSTGIADSFTLSSDFSFTPGIFYGSVTGLWANVLGTTQLQGTGKMDEAYKSPVLTASLTHKFNNRFLRGESLSLTFMYDAPAQSAHAGHRDIAQNLTGSFSYSGKGLITRLRYSLSGSLSYTWGETRPLWSVSLSTGASPFKGFSFSASATVGVQSSRPDKVDFAGSVSASYTLGGRSSLTTSLATSAKDRVSGSASFSYRPTGKDSLNLSLSAFPFGGSWKEGSLFGSYLHTGKSYALSVRQQLSREFERLSTSVNLSTTLVFADGVLGLSRTVGDQFLIVKPRLLPAKTQISLSRSMETSPVVVPRHFGSFVYGSFAPYVQTSVALFLGGDDFFMASSRLYTFTPRVRSAYVVHVKPRETYTVSGLIYGEDGKPLSQHSSPVYRADGGILELDADLYLFTDQQGRFILSGVEPGSYAFDLRKEGGGWILVRLEVPAMEKKNLNVASLCPISAFGPYEEEKVEGYDHVLKVEVQQLFDERTFWDILFPPSEEIPFGKAM